MMSFMISLRLSLVNPVVRKGISGILALTFFLAGSGLCFGEDVSAFNLIGLRFGLWRVNSTEVKPEVPEYSGSAKANSPYGEFFLTYGLKKGFLMGLSLGSCDRGETRFELEEGYYWESVDIYPISVSGNFYPLSSWPGIAWQPYSGMGVSYVIGSRSLDYGSVYPGQRYFFEGYVKTRSAFGAFAGAGLDFNMSRSLIINFDFKYRWVKFGEEVGGLKDYSGAQFTLGFAYVLGINK
jgi:outer membrane protein W